MDAREHRIIDLIGGMIQDSETRLCIDGFAEATRKLFDQWSGMSPAS